MFCMLRSVFTLVLTTYLWLEVYGECVNCATGSCLTNQSCNGCKRGLYGVLCDKVCPNQCATCAQNYENNAICQECSDGYGNVQYSGITQRNCAVKCMSGCKNCINAINNCTECLEGYFMGRNRYCHRCPSKCLACSSSSNCNKCDTGRYGVICRYSCSYDCKTCNSLNRCIECKPGYYGNKCLYRCRGHCKTCNSWDSCDECKSGYHGIYCQLQCAEKCASCTSNGECNGCKYGYHGQQCSGLCPKECETCFNSDDCPICPRQCTCSQNCLSCNSLGQCIECVSGYYFGPNCLRECGNGCKSCEMQNGRCLECSDGYFLYQRLSVYGCLSCSKNCKVCSSVLACQVCKPGYYGLNCESSCMAHCQICSSKYNCTVECPVGIGGINCNITCLPGCKHCRSIDACTMCQSGYYGTTCSSKCSSGCRSNICDRLTGYCIKGCTSTNFVDKTCRTCVNGKYGEKCLKTCSDKCPETCMGDTGRCRSCANGTYGDICEHKCSVNCLENLCKRETGYCRNGCKNNFYGARCLRKCSPGCKHDLCDHATGLCSLGCSHGFSGLTCDKESTGEANAYNNTSGLNTGFILIGLLIVVVAFGFLAIWLYSQRCRNTTGQQQTDASEMNRARLSITNASYTAADEEETYDNIATGGNIRSEDNNALKRK